MSISVDLMVKEVYSSTTSIWR